MTTQLISTTLKVFKSNAHMKLQTHRRHSMHVEWLRDLYRDGTMQMSNKRV